MKRGASQKVYDTAQVTDLLDKSRRTDDESKRNVQKKSVAEGSKSTNGNNITNLSSRKLSESEISVLSKGFSFVPTRNKIDMAKVQSDLAEWERRMRLREFFYNRERTGLKEEEPWKKKESDFTPEPGRDRFLDAYIEAVKGDIINGIKNKIDTNLTKLEDKALKALLNDTSIVIRPADKGSGVVVVDTDDYIRNLEAEVQGSDSYKETNGEGLMTAEKAVKSIANKMMRDGLITKDLREYLVPKHPEHGKLRGNPKLHKKGYPYRTIVNGIGTATENIAEVAEKELNEFVESTPSYIRDTTDFLNKLNDVTLPLPKDVILFCFDVVKLYPSIPKQEGMDACREALQRRKSPQIPTEAVLNMIRTVLENNVFQFNEKEYLQKEGVAIGSKLGRNFACTYMRKWDEELGKADKTPMFYKRYIDDGFGLWEHSIEELLQFQQHANQIHPNIKVELRWSRNAIEFLDTMVKVEDGALTTDLYTKPSDKHLYVNYKSSHPTHVKKAIPYGLGMRIKRICSKEKDYWRHRQQLKYQLRRRGYSSRFIDGQLQRVDGLDRKVLLKRRTEVR